jgi:hypothetical protein
VNVLPNIYGHINETGADPEGGAYLEDTEMIIRSRKSKDKQRNDDDR